LADERIGALRGLVDGTDLEVCAKAAQVLVPLAKTLGIFGRAKLDSDRSLQSRIQWLIDSPALDDHSRARLEQTLLDLSPSGR